MIPRTLPEGYDSRPASWQDVAEIVALRNVSARSTRGRDVTAVHWQKRHWYETEINLDTDSLLVLGGDGVIGYIELTSESPFVVCEMTGAVHPRFRRQGIGTALVGWAEARAAEMASRAPDGAAVFIHSSLFDNNQPGRQLLTHLGYNAVRDFVYLAIDMDNRPAAPVWPEGINVRLLEPPDWAKVGPALDEAFRDHWGAIDFEEGESEGDDSAPNPRVTDPEAFDNRYFNSPGLCFVAWNGEEVAGCCLCNAMTLEFPEAGYLGSLSVRRPWRRRGLGLALTLHALNAFYAQGTRRVLTDTDGDSLTGAYHVYQTAGMEIFRREHVYEKILRPGRDLLRR